MIEEKKNEMIGYIVITVLLSIILFVIAYITFLQFLNYTKQEVKDSEMSFTDTLDLITENCGSTFLTKKYGDDTWYIFNANDCIDGGYCKSSYIKLEDCLK